MPYADNEGIRIHFETEGQGPPLVLLHGFSGSLLDWVEFGYVDALRDDYSLILMDARGHGGSEKPHQPEDYSAERMATDLTAVLDALDIDKAHHWGFSMGGCIGWAINRFYPERLRSLISGAGPIEDWDQDPERPDPYYQYFCQRMTAFLSEGNEAWAARCQRWAGAHWRPAMRERCLADDLDAFIAVHLQAFRERAGLREAARMMDVHCLVYAGDAYGLQHLAAVRFGVGAIGGCKLRACHRAGGYS